MVLRIFSLINFSLNTELSVPLRSLSQNGLVLPTLQTMNKEHLKINLSLQECNATLHETVKSLSVAEQSEQHCLLEFKRCTSSTEQLKQNLDQATAMCEKKLQSEITTHLHNITLLNKELQHCSVGHNQLRQNVTLLKNDLENAHKGNI